MIMLFSSENDGSEVVPIPCKEHFKYMHLLIKAKYIAECMSEWRKLSTHAFILYVPPNV